MGSSILISFINAKRLQLIIFNDFFSSLRISCPCGTFLCAHCSSIDHSPIGCDVFDQYNDYLSRSGESRIIAIEGFSELEFDTTPSGKGAIIIVWTKSQNIFFSVFRFRLYLLHFLRNSHSSRPLRVSQVQSINAEDWRVCELFLIYFIKGARTHQLIRLCSLYENLVKHNPSWNIVFPALR